MSEPSAADRQWGRVVLLVGGMLFFLLIGLVIGFYLAHVL